MKSLIRIGMLCGVVVALVCLSGVLFADPEGQEVGAMVWKDSLMCGLAGYGPMTMDMQAVETPSGNVKLTCRGEAYVAPDKAIKETGLLCGIPGGPGLTTDSQIIVSASGQITLVCMSKANAD